MLVQSSLQFSSFLFGQVAHTNEKVMWEQNDLPLSVSAYTGSLLPAQRWITSVRAIVLRGKHILVVYGPEGASILPGGTVEPGETFEAALRREILQQTGWTLRVSQPIGFIHYHHLGPKPNDYPNPYPDFVHVVYLAYACENMQQRARLCGDYPARFLPPENLQKLTLTEHERLYIKTILPKD